MAGPRCNTTSIVIPPSAASIHRSGKSCRSHAGATLETIAGPVEAYFPPHRRRTSRRCSGPCGDAILAADIRVEAAGEITRPRTKLRS